MPIRFLSLLFFEKKWSRLKTEGPKRFISIKYLLHSAEPSNNAVKIKSHQRHRQCNYHFQTHSTIHLSAKNLPHWKLTRPLTHFQVHFVRSCRVHQPHWPHRLFIKSQLTCQVRILRVTRRWSPIPTNGSCPFQPSPWVTITWRVFLAAHWRTARCAYIIRRLCRWRRELVNNCWMMSKDSHVVCELTDDLFDHSCIVAAAVTTCSAF